MTWTSGDLLAALRPYETALTTAGLTPTSIKSAVDYARRFLRWSIGEYLPRSVVGPPRTRSLGTVDIEGLRDYIVGYEAELRAAKLQPGAIQTYVGQAGQFVRWLDGSYSPRDHTAGRLGRAAQTRTRRLARVEWAAPRSEVAPEGASLETAQKALASLVSPWISAGRPSQPGIGWSLRRWQAALPQHADLFLALPNPLDRAALISACSAAISDARSAERAFVAVMVWGQGNNGYAQHRTTQMLANTPRSADRLLEAARTLHSAGAMEAYRRLEDDCRLAGFGPAFGPKYLHFCQPSGQAPRALIFDKTVSEWISDNAGLKLSPLDWSARTYAQYLRQMHDWAASLDCRPEDLEMCIFRAMARERRSQWSD
jgi:hypothetical protein